ncbi:MAG: hypothetical protein WCW31_03240 [Patescibacteria group bacterium]
MIRAILINLCHVVCTFDANKRVMNFARHSPPALIDVCELSKSLLGSAGSRLLNDLERGKITASDYKEAIERLPHIPKLSDKDFWQAHVDAYAPRGEIMPFLAAIKGKHPLMKIVALADADQITIDHLVSLCYETDFDGVIARKQEHSHATFAPGALGLSARECLVIDLPQNLAWAGNMKAYSFDPERKELDATAKLASYLVDQGLI